MLGAAGEKAH